MTLTPKEAHRLHVLTLLESGRVTSTQAAEALGLTPPQVRRLRRTLRQRGPAGLAHGTRGRRSPRRLPEALQTQIVADARGRYAGLNDHHLTEKLVAVEGLAVSRATVRRILRAAGIAPPRRRQPPRAPDLPEALFQVQEEQVGHLGRELHVDGPVFREGDTHPEAREDAAQGPLSSSESPFRSAYSPAAGWMLGSQGCFPA